jgi:hypothetical protein
MLSSLSKRLHLCRLCQLCRLCRLTEPTRPFLSYSRRPLRKHQTDS